MNVQVLGSDIVYGADSAGSNIFTDMVSGISSFFKSDTGKVVAQAVASSVGQKLTPTQKAQLANIQEAAGITPMPQNYTTPGYYPSQGFDYQKNLPYLIVGGAVVVGLMMMLATKGARV
jgi:hypothetical protein